MTEKELAKLLQISRARLKQLRNGMTTHGKYYYAPIVNDTDYKLLIENNRTEIWYFESGIKKIKNYFSK